MHPATSENGTGKRRGVHEDHWITQRRPYVGVPTRTVPTGPLTVLAGERGRTVAFAETVTIACEAEVLQGLEAKGSDRLWRAYRSVLKDRVQVLPVDIRVAEHYACVQAASARAGRTRPAFDLLIAATALVHELTLATCNVRHFEGIEGLSVEDWAPDPDGAA